MMESILPGPVLGLFHRYRRWLFMLLLLIGTYVYLSWLAPYRVMLQFVDAVERRDVKRIFALSHPAERELAGLTLPAVEQAFSHAFPMPVRRDGEPIPSARHPGGWRGDAERTTPGEDTVCCWRVYWKDARSGQRLPARWFLPVDGREQHWGMVTLKPSSEGWRVFVTDFLLGTYQSAWGKPQGRQELASVARQVGLKGFVSSDERLLPLDLQ
jgi:hypothetical protein